MSDDPRISVLLPSTGRHDRLVHTCIPSLLRTLKESALGPNQLDLVLAIDRDPETLHSLASTSILDDLSFTLSYSNSYEGCSRAWNRAYDLSRGDLIVFAADDLVFQPDWLRHTLKALNELPDSSGLVGFNDGHTNGEILATHWLATRGFINQYLGGHVAWHDYLVDFNDVEATERAIRAGRYAWAKDACVLHEHYLFGSREKDETDARFRPAFEQSRKAFIKRKSLGFPDSQDTVISTPAPSSS